jgi:hypothetical protein
LKGAIALLRELLLTGAVTVATTRDDQPLAEGTPLDAMTVVQLDGDVLNVLRDGAELEGHWARVRQARARLTLLHACWLSVERGAFVILSLGAQLVLQRWAADVILQQGFGALWKALAEPAHVFSSVLGLLVPIGLYASKWVVREALRRALLRQPLDVFSARSG